MTVGTCRLCAEEIKGGEEFYPTALPAHVICQQRKHEGRCLRCGNWPTICGHGLSFKERIKSVKPLYNEWAPTK